MMVTFISQCQKKAHGRTRRVLDSFANRIGDNAWQTVITQEGLQAVKKLLRKTATKNTAVSCHWIRSRSRSDLVWVVGNKQKFDQTGCVPVNTTEKDNIKSDWENDWQYLPLIKALTAMAALLHDWGKASKLFQTKLNPKNKQGFKGDPVRHEWVSCVLLHAFVTSSGKDNNWLKNLAEGKINETDIQNQELCTVKTPLFDLPVSASLVAWLIITHHRLPLPNDGYGWRGDGAKELDKILKRITQEWGYENKQNEKDYQKNIDNCFKFPKGLMKTSLRWIKELKRWAKKLDNCEDLIKKSLEDGSWRVVLHHARLCLMLGDHYYSSKDNDKTWQGTQNLYANTDRSTKQFKQKLDEHLCGVTKYALRTSHLLPEFEFSPPVTKAPKSLKTKSTGSYIWQEKAVDKIKEWKKGQSKKQGFFVVNMASTGCGKTFANAKVMQTLSKDGESLRYILALGLRTLTLQTGDEYRERIGLKNNELAVLIGSRAVMELHQQSKNNEKEDYQNSGSESEESLLEEYIDYDCDIPEEGLATVLKKEKDKQFLYSPVLACTIDHLMAATETKRGGRYILPSLRLMSSDLVIDEIDDFTGSDLIAIGRLIHLTGMLGRKVMISSATIPPDLAIGFFNAYREGWLLFAKTRDIETKIGCAWVDEFKTQVENNKSIDTKVAIELFEKQHNIFTTKRVEKLQQQPAKRKAQIIQCQNIINECEDEEDKSEETKQWQYFEKIQREVIEKHKEHSFTDKQSKKQISFGLVRVANINPCIELAEYLLRSDYPDDIEVRIMAYHSQQVLLLRSEQEKHLDLVLKRKQAIPEALANPVVRNHINKTQTKNLIFILVATPVEEVGRDHDFDWAVVEPSSYRSIIQLAGRVRRHRISEVKTPNIGLLQYNLKGIKKKDNPYSKPGFESKHSLSLKTHNLSQLIDEKQIKKSLDAIPRVQKATILKPNENLADLEHEATAQLLTQYSKVGPESLQGYLTQKWWLTALPQLLNPFRKSEKTEKLFLMFDEGEKKIIEKDNKGNPIERGSILSIKISDGAIKNKDRLWLERDYELVLEQKAKTEKQSKRYLSLKYGELNVPIRDSSEYEYSDQFGLKRS